MKPEDFRASATRPFTGEEYLASLRDDREIYIYGDRVKDVTSHPAFRNAAASMARLYDALHDPQSKEKLCWETDTGNGGYTHKFFRYARSADELRQQRDAIAEWSRLTYGWMGRTPDYKAAFGSALGANPGFYGRFEDNAKTWYKRIQEACLYLNHAIVNPPIDRDKPVDQVKDVFISVDEEVDGGIVVSGAKVVATNSALTHYNFVGQGSAQLLGDNTDFALMFIAPMNTPGMKLICRPSYELVAGIAGSPFDYPLSSRFDENDAILVMDKVFIPWENVLIYRDFERCKQWFPQGGFGRLFPMQGCTRLAVKLDFITGALYKALQCTGSLEFRGVQAQVGEVVAWRNLFWSLTDAMYGNASEWHGGAFLPSAEALQAYRVLAPQAYPEIKKTIEQVVASGLIYLPSGVRDLHNPQLDKYLSTYCRGSGGMGHRERIKILKLLWDAIGSEFGGRHELYEINYAGSQDEIRHAGPAPGDRQRGDEGHARHGRAVHGRLRRERLDRAAPAQPGRHQRARSHPPMTPASPPEVIPMSQLEPRQQAFRNAMAHLSAAVNVITSNGPAGRCGITATAVCSVTDSPPTLMLCINRNSEMNTVFKANGRLCVNVLSGEHEEVARHFAGMTEVPMERRFALHDWREGLAGLPVLHGALANLQGRIAEVQEIGTHSVLLLELEDIQVLEQGDGLVYFSRSFHRLQRACRAA